MNVLVLNGGSSSMKFSLFLCRGGEVEPTVLFDGEVSGIGTPEGRLQTTAADGTKDERAVDRSSDAAGAIATVLDAVRGAGQVDAVGYRVVHPGATIRDHVVVTEEVLRALEAARELAPLHDPEAVQMMREAMRRLPSVPHVACFDTVFHETMPEEARVYAIPKEIRERGVRRYGFHGLSCESVVRQMQRMGPLPKRMVIAHLGSGCSVTACVDGRSVDTTMGLTPTGGVVMGTRPGDLDPGLMLYLLRAAGDDGKRAAGEVEAMVNHRSGMVALSELPNDMRAVRKAGEAGNEAALLALKVFTRAVRKAIGGFAWLMGGLDAVVFTGGIGEHDAATRAEVLQGSEVLVSPALNETSKEGMRQIGASNAATMVLVAPAQEDLVIALHVWRMIGQRA